MAAIDILLTLRGNATSALNALREFQDGLQRAGGFVGRLTGTISGTASAFGAGITAPARTAASVLASTFVIAQQGATSFLRKLTEVGRAIFFIKEASQSIAGLAFSFVGANAQLEVFQITYATLLKSADAARNRIEKLQELNVKSPFNISDIIEADIQLQATGRRTERLLLDVIDAASVLGGTPDKLRDVNFAISRIASSDFGFAFQRLRELAVASRSELEGKGLVFDKQGSYQGTAEQALAAIQAIIEEKFAGGAEAASKAFLGVLRNVGDQFFILRSIFGQSIFDRLKPEFESLLALMQSPRVEAAAAFLGQAFAFTIDIILDVFHTIFDAASTFVGGLDGLFNKILLPIAGVAGAIIGFFQPLVHAIELIFQGSFEGAGQLVGEFVKNLGAIILGTIADLASGLFGGGENVIASFAEGLYSGAARFVSAALDFVTGMIASFLQGFSPPKEGPLSTIDTWFPRVINAYLGSWSEADWSALVDLTDFVADTFEKLVAQGKMSAQQAQTIVLGRNGAPGINQLIAGAVDEINRNGKVSASSMLQIQGLLGEQNKELFKQIQARLQDALLGNQISKLKAQLADLDDPVARQKLEDAITKAKDAVRDARNASDRKAAKEQLAILQTQKKQEDNKQNGLRAQIRLLEKQQSIVESQIKSAELAERFRERELQFLEQIAEKQVEASGSGSSAADKASDAAFRYSLHIADNAGKLELLRGKLAEVEVGSDEYFAILTQIFDLEKQMNEEAIRGAKSREDAQWDYNFALADNQGKLDMLREKLAQLEVGSEEYYRTALQLAQLEQKAQEEAAKDAGDRAKAARDYNFDLQTTAGKLEILRGELANTQEGSVEYYRILGQIHDLEQTAAKEAEAAAKKAAKGTSQAGRDASEGFNAAANAAADIGDGVSKIQEAARKARLKWIDFMLSVRDSRDEVVKTTQEARVLADEIKNKLANSAILKPLVDNLDEIKAAFGRVRDAIKGFFSDIREGISDAKFENGGIFELSNFDFKELARDFKKRLSEAIGDVDFKEVGSNFIRKIKETFNNIDWNKVFETPAGKILLALAIIFGGISIGPMLAIAIGGAGSYILGALTGLLGVFGTFGLSLGGLFTPLTGIFTRFGTALGIVLQPVMTFIIGLGRGALVLLSPLGSLGGLLGTLASHFSFLLAPVEALGSFIGGLLGPFSALLGPLAAIAGPVGLIILALALLTNQFPDVQARIEEFIGILGGWALEAIPVVLSALNGFIQAVLTWIGQQIPLLIETLKRWSFAFLNFIVDALPLVLNGLVDLILNIADFIVKNAPRLLHDLAVWGVQLVQWVIDRAPDVLKAITDAFDRIIAWVLENAPKFAESLYLWAKQFVEWVAPQIPGMLEQLGLLIVQLIEWLGQKAAEIGLKLLEWGEQFINWIGPQIPGILLGLGELLLSILAWIVEKVPVIVGKITEWAGAIVGFVGTALGGLPGALLQLIGFLITWLGEQIPAIVATIGGWANAALSWIGTTVSNLPGQLWEIIKAIVTFVGSAIITIIETFGTWVGAALSWIGTALMDAPAKLDEIVVAIATWVATAVKDVVAAFLAFAIAYFEWIVYAVANAPKKLDEILTAISTWVSGAIEDIKTFFSAIGPAIVESIRAGIEGAWQGLVDWFNGKLQEIADLWPFSEPKDPNSNLRGITQWGANFTNTIAGSMESGSMRSSLESATNPLVTLIDNLVGPITTASTNAFNAMKPVIQGVLSEVLVSSGIWRTNMESIFAGMISSVPPIFAQIGVGIKETFNTSSNAGIQIFITLIDTLRGMGASFHATGSSLGDNFAAGVTAGINKGAGAIEAAARRAARRALEAAEKELEIASPSAATRDRVGLPFMQGIAEGITRNIRLAEHAITPLGKVVETASNIMTPIKDALVDPMTEAGLAIKDALTTNLGDLGAAAQKAADNLTRPFTKIQPQVHGMLQNVTDQLGKSPLQVAFESAQLASPLGGSAAFMPPVTYSPHIEVNGANKSNEEIAGLIDDKILVNQKQFLFQLQQLMRGRP